MSANTDIRHEDELESVFLQIIAEEPDVSLFIASDGVLEVRLDRQRHRFRPEYRLNPSIAELEGLLADRNAKPAPVLVVPSLNERFLGLCRRKSFSCIDLNGRLYLRAPGFLVDRGTLPGRAYRYVLEPRNLFADKSARIVRTLLTDRGRVWTQGEIVPRAKVSSALASRIVRHLVQQGYLEKLSARTFRVADPLALLDAWAAADEFPRRARTLRYTLLEGAPLRIADALLTLARQHGLTLAFTQWLAGWLRHPYTEPAVVSAYVSRLPPPGVLESAGFRAVTEAGKVWLHVPTDEGVFLEPQSAGELLLVSDAQIYLDLLNTGLRGPDQAAALRAWDRFCTPP